MLTSLSHFKYMTNRGYIILINISFLNSCTSEWDYKTFTKIRNLRVFISELLLKKMKYLYSAVSNYCGMYNLSDLSL